MEQKICECGHYKVYHLSGECDGKHIRNMYNGNCNCNQFKLKQKLTNCCNELFIAESDVCSKCKEHAGVVEEDEM